MRTLFATGRTPHHDPTVELSRLRRELAEAEANFRDRPSHFYEARVVNLRMALDDLYQAHPELSWGRA